MEYEMGKGANDRKHQSTKNSYPKAVHFEAFDESSQEPQEEAVDGEREDTERQEVDRQSQKKQYRFDGDIDQPPHKRQDECRPEALDADSRHDIRQRQEPERTDKPFEQ